jgi:putative lipoprotein
VRAVSRGTLRLVALLAFVGASSVATNARADEVEDPWFGRDKVIHYSVSAGIAGAGYAAGALLFDTRAHALATGAGAAVLAGVGKELADLAGYGDPSWKDLAWDGLGMVTGLALAWGIDLAIRGVSVQHPLFAGIRGGIAF